MSEHGQKIYENLMGVLQAKNIRKAELSRETGIPDSSIRSWSTGVIPNVVNTYKVCQFLGITVEELVTGEFKKDQEEKAPERPQAEPSLRLSYMETQLLDRFNHLDERDRDVLLSLADVLQKKYRGLYTEINK